MLENVKNPFLSLTNGKSQKLKKKLPPVLIFDYLSGTKRYFENPTILAIKVTLFGLCLYSDNFLLRKVMITKSAPVQRPQNPFLFLPNHISMIVIL